MWAGNLGGVYYASALSPTNVSGKGSEKERQSGRLNCR
jgi:hypothetical protein